MHKIYGESRGQIFHEEIYGEYDEKTGCVYIKDYYDLFKYFKYSYVDFETNILCYRTNNMYYEANRNRKYIPLKWQDVKRFIIKNDYYKDKTHMRLSEDGLCIIEDGDLLYACPDWITSTINLCVYTRYSTLISMRCNALIDKCSTIKHIIINKPAYYDIITAFVESSKHPENVVIEIREPFYTFSPIDIDKFMEALSEYRCKVLIGYADEKGKIKKIK